MDQATFQKLGLLLSRALKGDKNSTLALRRIRAKAQAGNQEAKVYHNTLAVLHWKRREGEKKYALAEAFYGKLMHKDPAARSRLARIVQGMRAGDPECLKVFRVLKSVHHKYKASAWTGPGQPKIGGYGMPNIHRAGIDIPGLGNIPIPGAQYYPTPGINPYGNPLPLNPQSIAGLLNLIAQARTAPSPWQIPGLPGGMPQGLPDVFRGGAPQDTWESSPAPFVSSTQTTPGSQNTAIRSFSASAPKPITSFGVPKAGTYDYAGAPPPRVPCAKWDLAKRMGQSPAILNALRLKCEAEAGLAPPPMPYIR
jgi:hypothetical protein